MDDTRYRAVPASSGWSPLGTCQQEQGVTGYHSSAGAVTVIDDGDQVVYFTRYVNLSQRPLILTEDYSVDRYMRVTVVEVYPLEAGAHEVPAYRSWKCRGGFWRPSRKRV
jgi:hypothetical protein